MQKGENKIAKDLVIPAPKANCISLIFLLKRFSICCSLSMLEIELLPKDKKTTNLYTAYES